MRAATLAIMLLLTGCSGNTPSLCANTLIETKRDPAGPLAAFRYVRDCGATADFAMTVAIGPADKGVAGARTVFVADSDHGAAETDGKSIWLEMHWASPHMLSVGYAAKARVFKRVERAGGAQIAYRATDRMTSPMVD